MTNYVGRAIYEKDYNQEKDKYKQLDADRAIRLFDEYDIPITASKEETPDGTLFGPFPDGSYILSFIHLGEQNMFSASSKDKINQLFQDITFASVEDRMIEKIDKKKESPPNHHPMLKAWEKNYHLSKAIELNISKALSYCDYRMDHIMENITHFVEPSNTDAIKDILKGLKNVGNILRDNQNASPSRKMKIASTEYPTPLGFIIVVNYNPSNNRLRVSTIKSTERGERFTPAYASDGPYTPEFLDAIQSGTLGLNACPNCLSEGCDACQNGIIDLSPTQEAFLRNIVSNQFKTAGGRFKEKSTLFADDRFETSEEIENYNINWIKPSFKEELNEYFENDDKKNYLSSKGIVFSSDKELISALEKGKLTAISKNELLKLRDMGKTENINLNQDAMELALKDIHYAKSFNSIEQALKKNPITLQAPIILKIENSYFGFSGNRRTNLAMKYNLPMKFWVVPINHHSQSADDNSLWIYAFSQLNSMLSNFKKLNKVSWTISDDKLNSLFQELLPLFVKYALIIRDKPNSVSQPMVDSANKIISELSLIFNIEV